MADRYWSTEEQRWIYPGEVEMPDLPTPIGHVTMRTRSGCGDGIVWTEWAQCHGAPLFAVAQMEAYAEAAVRQDRARLASQIEAFSEAGTDVSLSDVVSLILYGKGAVRGG